MIRLSGVYHRRSFVSEDTRNSVGDDCTVYLAIRNKTANENLQIPSKTVLGKAEPTVFTFRPITVDPTDGTSVPCVEHVNNNNFVNFSDTSSEFSFFALFRIFFSSTELSEEDMSESEKRAQTDPQLLKPIPGPDLSSVLSFWGESARDQLAKVFTEYDDLFMKHKADIGKRTIAKHRIELEPEAIPHREGARRMSPDKAAKANQEVRNLLALGLIQPSYSPWASRIVIVKKKTGELRFCCDFRPLNDVIVKDAFRLE